MGVTASILELVENAAVANGVAALLSVYFAAHGWTYTAKEVCRAATNRSGTRAVKRTAVQLHETGTGVAESYEVEIITDAQTAVPLRDCSHDRSLFRDFHQQ